MGQRHRERSGRTLGGTVPRLAAVAELKADIAWRCILSKADFLPWPAKFKTRFIRFALHMYVRRIAYFKHVNTTTRKYSPLLDMLRRHAYSTPGLLLSDAIDRGKGLTNK